MKRLLYITILLLCVPFACVKEQPIVTQNSDEVAVLLTLRLPSVNGSRADSRAITATDEQSISKVDILAFVEGTDGQLRYAYRAPIVSTNTASLPNVTITATVQGNSRGQIFLIAVNTPDATLDNVTLNMSFATAQLRLILSNANEWKANSSADYDPLPMYAQTAKQVVTESTGNIGTYELVRMLARIDVSTKNTIPTTEFELTEAHIFNRNSCGTLPIDFTNATVWDVTGKKALKTNIPATDPVTTNPPKIYLPSYYTSPGYSSTPYKTTTNNLIRSIYTFEAAGVIEADRLDATTVIIGGKYNGSPTTTYYRIDIHTSSTPAGYISQDILRNHLYNIEIQSVAGTGAVTPEDAFKGDVQITAEITEYNMANHSIIFDGIYNLTLSRERMNFDDAGGNVTLNITTNYDGADGAHPAGININTSSTAAWLSVTPTGALTSPQTLTLTAAPNTAPGAVARNTSFIITAGNINYEFKVNQSITPWLTTNASGYVLDGTISSFNVDATSDWTVAIKSGSNTPVLGNLPMQALLTNEGNSGTAKPVYFSTYNDLGGATPTMIVQEVILTFTDKTGLNPDKDVKVMLASGIIQPKANSYIIPKGWICPILIPIEQATDGWELAKTVETSITVPSLTGYNASFLWGEMGVADSNTASDNAADVGLIVAAGPYILVQAGNTEGNFVVAMKDATNTNIIWSWHIWVTDGYYPYVTSGQIPDSSIGDADVDGTPNTSGNAPANWLRYNLGAFKASPDVGSTMIMTSASNTDLRLDSRGLYYQWGRKDPFPMMGSVYTTGTLTTAAGATNGVLTNPRMFATNQTTYYGTVPGAGIANNSWGNGGGKTAFDPCPPAYKIPAELDAWTVGGWLGSNTGAFNTTQGRYYPYGGLRSGAQANITELLQTTMTWASAAASANTSRRWRLPNNTWQDENRWSALSVRCVAE